LILFSLISSSINFLNWHPFSPIQAPISPSCIARLLCCNHFETVD
jgi:hypothetical protein